MNFARGIEAGFVGTAVTPIYAYYSLVSATKPG
jgi:hypothetical protein